MNRVSPSLPKYNRHVHNISSFPGMFPVIWETSRFVIQSAAVGMSDSRRPASPLSETSLHAIAQGRATPTRRELAKWAAVMCAEHEDIPIPPEHRTDLVPKKVAAVKFAPKKEVGYAVELLGQAIIAGVIHTFEYSREQHLFDCREIRGLARSPAAQAIFDAKNSTS